VRHGPHESDRPSASGARRPEKLSEAVWRTRLTAQVVSELRLWAVCAWPLCRKGAQRALFRVLQG